VVAFSSSRQIRHPGPLLDRLTQPNLFREIDQIADALSEQIPREVYLIEQPSRPSAIELRPLLATKLWKLPRCQPVSDRLPGNQKVISANRLSDGLQISSDRASDFSILILKGQRMNRARKKSLESLLVKISSRTFRDTVPEFEQSDGRHKYLAPEVSRLPKLGTDRGWIPIDQRDASISIQEIVHLKISRRGVMD